MPVNLICGLSIILGLAIVFFTVFRRLLGMGDQIAMMTLLVVGMRDIVGNRLFFMGMTLLGLISLNCTIATVLIFMSLATCAGDKPSQFCRTAGW